MNSFVTVICYVLLVYGLTNLFVNGMGPCDIIDKFRVVCGKISKTLGDMLECMMCTGNNIGLLLSALNLFLFRSVAFTPFNLIFGMDMCKWYLILPFDAALSSGVCWFIHWITEKNKSFGERE